MNNKLKRKAMHRINHKGRDVIFCDITLQHYKKHSWHWQTSRGVHYLCRWVRKGYTVPFHREVLGLEKGDKRVGDHISGETTDNRMSNLRVVTRSQSNINRKTYNKSGTPRNIHRTSAKKESYRLIIRGVHYGTYRTVDEACAVQARLYEKIHGEQSKTYLRGGEL